MLAPFVFNIDQFHRDFKTSRLLVRSRMETFQEFFKCYDKWWRINEILFIIKYYKHILNKIFYYNMIMIVREWIGYLEAI